MQPTTIKQVEWWLENLEHGLERGECQSPGFLRPFHMLTLVQLLKKHGQSELALPPQMTTYATRMGVWEAAGLEPPCQVPKSNPSGRFLPVAPLLDRREVESSVMQLSAIIQRTRVDQQTLQSLGIALYELLTNCYAHADIAEGLHGLACAQPWLRANLAQIAIVDTGIGVRRSLQLNEALHGKLDMQNACELASTYGITSKPGKGHSGYGLTLARDLMQQHGGHFLVVSGYEAYAQHGEEIVVECLKTSWEGTLVLLEWPLDKTLNTKTVYSAWPLPDYL